MGAAHFPATCAYGHLLELPSYPRVISVPWLSDPGVGAPKLPDEGEYPNAICNHGWGLPLGHTLLAMQEVAWPVPHVPSHKCGQVAVSVKRKLRATGPLMPDSP